MSVCARERVREPVLDWGGGGEKLAGQVLWGAGLSPMMGWGGGKIRNIYSERERERER